jgi:hypothetical protein
VKENLPYDRFVSKLINPAAPGDPDGFLVGVNWRGETSAAVTPWMQASQNTAQVSSASTSVTPATTAISRGSSDAHRSLVLSPDARLQPIAATWRRPVRGAAVSIPS